MRTTFSAKDHQTVILPWKVARRVTIISPSYRRVISTVRRRTGTMLAAYLIASGMSASDALQAIFTANPGLELREAQQVFLQALPKTLQG
ncbi:MAG: hypothetical protein GDA43_23070 [Hormoscilla sp. SP5CHS1]|nr:hypothetical protein [Hormoscilla sp. SP12CHS1]MBC6455704.1 hypothetical protein [Hormoscilla sp. SP5CHS1]